LEHQSIVAHGHTADVDTLTSRPEVYPSKQDWKTHGPPCPLDDLSVLPLVWLDLEPLTRAPEPEVVVRPTRNAIDGLPYCAPAHTRDLVQWNQYTLVIEPLR